jgi:hypothetical protein
VTTPSFLARISRKTVLPENASSRTELVKLAEIFAIRDAEVRIC